MRQQASDIDTGWVGDWLISDWLIGDWLTG